MDLAPVHALFAVVHAFKAAVAATGALPPNRATLPELAGILQELAHGEDLTTPIPLDIYWAGTALQGMTPEVFADHAEADVINIRRLAMKGGDAPEGAGEPGATGRLPQ